MIAHYPHGCGSDYDDTLTGYTSNLADCLETDTSWEAPDDSTVAFVFPDDGTPDDGTTSKWKLFSSSDCSTKIAQGEGCGCETVPQDQKIGAMIVYT
jgi:hypothetical protein